MYADEIRELVISKLNEVTPFGDDSGETLLAGGNILTEVKPVYQLIDDSINQAADEMLQVIPINKLTQISQIINNPLNEQSEMVGIINRPLDMLRLHTIKFNSWSKPVHLTVKPNEPLYDLQSNIYTRGTPQKPVVIDNGTELLCYSLSVTQEQGIMKYITYFNHSIDYPLSVAELIALNTACKVYDIIALKEQAQILTQEKENLLNNISL